MDTDNMLQNRLETCFKSIANKEIHKLDLYFMKKTLQVYNYNVENKKKDSLRNLTSFLQHCEKGRWADAVSFYSAALKEYEKEYVKTKTSHSTAQASTASKRENNDGRYSDKEVGEQELMVRSKYASIRLKDNNPNITDLSGPNRPIKLAERFSELYSNKYTDAFEELSDKDNRPDENIKILLDIVKTAHAFCMAQRKQMIDDKMKSEVLDTNLRSPDDKVRRYDKLMNLREAAEAALQSVRENFMKTKINAVGERTREFAEQCVEIVWLMCIQQPPVHLEWVEKKQEKFKPDLYRGYTRSGDVVEFCVWPVVRLHEDGPILTKGIAQGCD